jgi:orotate phosphoribosyltransferase
MIDIKRLKHDYIDAKVIMDGHFKLTSERHSNRYVNKDIVYGSFAYYDTVSLIAEKCKSELFNVLTGPAVAGAVLAASVHTQLCSQAIIGKRFIYPEKINNLMEFRRGYDKIITNQKVLIIEDIITTGSSIMKTAESIEKNGGIVTGAICIWNRSNWEPENKRFKVQSLFNDSIESWEPKDCPLCKDKIPLIDPKTGMEITE